MPNYLGKINSKFLTPVPAILTTSIIIGLAILYLDVVKIAKLTSAFKVLMFIFNELSVIVLRETNAQWYNLHSDLHFIICSNFGILSGVVLLSYLGLMPLLSVLGVFLLGIIIFIFYGSKTERSGVISSYGFLSFYLKVDRQKKMKVTQKLLRILLKISAT